MALLDALRGRAKKDFEEPYTYFDHLVDSKNDQAGIYINGLPIDDWDLDGQLAGKLFIVSQAERWLNSKNEVLTRIELEEVETSDWTTIRVVNNG
jgi:hypothetical protein